MTSSTTPTPAIEAGISDARLAEIERAASTDGGLYYFTMRCAEVRSLIARLRSTEAASSGVRDGWRDIASAPRDGTHILAVLHRAAIEDMDGVKRKAFSEVREIWYRDYVGFIGANLPWHAGDPFDAHDGMPPEHMGDGVPTKWMPMPGGLRSAVVEERANHLARLLQRRHGASGSEEDIEETILSALASPIPPSASPEPSGASQGEDVWPVISELLAEIADQEQQAIDGRSHVFVDPTLAHRANARLLQRAVDAINLLRKAPPVTGDQP